MLLGAGGQADGVPVDVAGEVRGREVTSKVVAARERGLDLADLHACYFDDCSVERLHDRASVRQRAFVDDQVARGPPRTMDDGFVHRFARFGRRATRVPHARSAVDAMHGRTRAC